MKLTYWIAHASESAYSIRKSTKKACLEQMKEWGAEGYQKPVRVSVIYRSALDLLDQSTGEGRLFWETETLQ